MTAALLVLSCSLASAAELDASSPPPSGPWRASVAVATTTPAVLPGLAIGALADASRRLRGGPLFLSARASWASASAANETWIINHDELTLAAGVGAARALGVGRVWAAAGGGALVLHEGLDRHQLQRIEAAGVPGGTETSTVLGPYAYVDLGAGVRLRGPFGAFVAGGPETSRLSVASSGARWTLGAAIRIGVTVEF